MKHIVKRDGPWMSDEAGRQRGIPVATWCGEEVPGRCYGSLAEAVARGKLGEPLGEQACQDCLARATEAMNKDAAVPLADVTQRKALLAAAVILYKMTWDSGPYVSTGAEHEDETEATLVENVKKAQANLDGFRLSRATRMGLDAMLPGWVGIDHSDHTPRAKWHAFVSNQQDEWVAWLVEHSRLPREKAEELVAEKFKMASQ